MIFRNYKHNISIMFSHMYGNTYYGIGWVFFNSAFIKFLQTLKVFGDYSHQLSYLISKSSLNHPTFTLTLEVARNLLRSNSLEDLL